MKTLKFLFILLITLSSFYYFRPVLIGETSTFYNYSFGLLLGISLVLISYKAILLRSFGKFTVPIILITAAIIISAFCAKAFWDQGLQYSLSGSVFKGFGYLFYFYLFYSVTDIAMLEKVINWIGISFIGVFLISFIIYPRLIVYYNEVSSTTTLQRIFVAGDGFLFLFYFLHLNKFKLTKSPVSLAFLVLAALCIVLNQTRIYFVGCFAITVFYLFRSTKVYIKLLAIIVVTTAYIYIANSSAFESLQAKTQTDLSKGENYIRLQAADYYLTTFQRSVYTQIFGSGNSFGDKNTYTLFMNRIQKQRGYYIDDLGFVGLYIRYGLLALIAYLIIFYKAFKLKITSNYTYAKMFIVFLLFTGLTTSATFNASFIFAIVFCLYIIEKGYNPFSRFKFEPQVQAAQ